MKKRDLFGLLNGHQQTASNGTSRIRRFLDYWQPATASSHSMSAYNFGQDSMLLGDQDSVISADECCPHKRRFLPAYQRRLKLVRDSWLYLLSGVVVFQFAAPVVVSLCLFSTFLSFAFLDETPINVITNK